MIFDALPLGWAS